MNFIRITFFNIFVKNKYFELELVFKNMQQVKNLILGHSLWMKFVLVLDLFNPDMNLSLIWLIRFETKALK